MFRRLAILAFLVLIPAAALSAQNDTPTMNRPGKGILDVAVTDQDGAPLKGVKVSVPGFRSTTGAGGTARFGLFPGRYAVLVAKDGYRGKRVNAGITPGKTTTTRVTLQKLPSSNTAPPVQPRSTAVPRTKKSTCVPQNGGGRSGTLDGGAAARTVECWMEAGMEAAGETEEFSITAGPIFSKGDEVEANLEIYFPKNRLKIPKTFYFQKGQDGKWYLTGIGSIGLSGGTIRKPVNPPFAAVR